MDHYLRAAASSANLHAISYDQLNNDRNQTVKNLLTVCEINPQYFAAAMTGYDKDSQQGSEAVNDLPTFPLTQEQQGTITQLVRRHFTSGSPVA